MQQEPRGAAPGVHGSERRECSPNDSKPQIELDAVAIWAPWAGDEERALRRRIHKARDIAQARAARSEHSRAKTLFWIAAQMAGDWVFTRAPDDELTEVLGGLSRLFLVAGMVERLEAPDVE